MIITTGGHQFKIRKCIDKDYRFVYNLLKRNMQSFFVKHWGAWKPEVFKKAFNKKNIKIIEYKTKRIGYYDIEHKTNFSYINNIQISARLRGKRLGSNLMNLIEKEVKKHKGKEIRIRVFVDNPAKAFYYNLGYKKLKGDKSSQIMRKRLSTIAK